MAPHAATQIDEQVRQYLGAVRSQGSHTGKVLQFILFLEKTFQLTSSDYEVEEPVGHLQVRGRIDTVIGDSLFEFKRDLRRELLDAEAQLKKYLESFHQQNALRRCVGVATDGIKFRVYQPDFSAGPTPDLYLIEEQDLARLSGEDAVLWLDRYLFRRTPKVPDERDVSERFGARSPTHALTLSALKQWWADVKGDPPVAVKYELWQKQLTIVYGEGVGTEDLFLQHTYLATIAKLLASVVFPQPALGRETDILTGAYFQALGIENFIEEDLFTWPLHPKVQVAAERFLRGLRTQLADYDPAGFTEDVLKGLYQELVDPQMRHDLGEFYTPDWLAEYMLRETLGNRPQSRVLDPACGSGTFLFLAIRLVAEALNKRRWSKGRILEHIQGNIVGVDVHPLAVLIARTNYLIAAAPLLHGRLGRFLVPLYLGDSLMYRSVVGPMIMPDVPVEADGERLMFPDRLKDDPGLFDDVVANLVYWAEQQEAGREPFRRYLQGKGFSLNGRAMLMQSFEALVRLFAAGRDSVWRFVIRNLVRPYILSKGQPFDLVVGNPPWLSLRYIRSPDYQAFVKRRTRELTIRPRGAKLVTQLELAALFFADAANHYLRDGGTIAFVMPRSVLVARQHEEFVKFRFGPFGVRCERVVDLEGVAPLFSVPACVIVACKGRGTLYPVPSTVVSGRLPRKNTSYPEARQCLAFADSEWERPPRPSEPSYYLDTFRQGATIVPRRLWFVRLISDPRLGFDPAAPLVESDLAVPAKAPWDQIAMRGRVERQFLYASVLGTDIVPFHCVRLRSAVLPLELDAVGRPRLLTAATALSRGHALLAEWLGQAEGHWAAHKTASAPVRLTDWVDYLGKLSAQFPQPRRYRVLYSTSATYLAAAVLHTRGGLALSGEAGRVPAAGLAVDHMAYCYATDSADEAHFLCGWLNSPLVDAAIKQRQARGLFGPRHIHKLPLELPLPRFNPRDPDHVQMAACAEEAAAKAPAIAASVKTRSVGALRRAIRTHADIAPLLARIDELARRIGGL